MTTASHQHQPVDAAALAASALAGALAVYIEPGPFDWMSLITGTTLLSVIVAFQYNKCRTVGQSWAYGTVIAFVFLLIGGFVLELLYGHGSLAGVCRLKEECKPNEFESRVGSFELSILWLFVAVGVFWLDRRYQKQ